MLAHLDSVNKKIKHFRREAFEKILAVSRLICVDFCNHLSCFGLQRQRIDAACGRNEGL